MKNTPILLPLLLILTMTSFLIVFSQAISKEVEHKNEEFKNTFKQQGLKELCVWENY